MSYKWCAVPQCTNTSIKTPEKLFICVPKNFKMRQKWLELSRRNCLEIKPSSNVYFCEDHFNMEKDMANYYQYKMGLSKRIIMVDKVLPSKFSCQEDCVKRLVDAGTSQSVVAKKLKRNLVKGRKNTLQQPIIRKKMCFARAERSLSNDQSTHTVDEPYTMGLPLYVDFRCKVCLKDIIGFRYSCLQCVDWDMCASCETRGEHPEHYVLRLPAPNPDAESEAVLKEIRKHIEDLLRLKNEINEIIVKQEVVQVKEEFEIDIEESILEMNNESVADVYVCQGSIPVNMRTPTDNAFRQISRTKEREKNAVTESVTILQNIKKEPKDKSLFLENTLSDIHEKEYCENDVTT